MNKNYRLLILKNYCNYKSVLKLCKECNRYKQYKYNRGKCEICKSYLYIYCKNCGKYFSYNNFTHIRIHTCKDKIPENKKLDIRFILN